MSAQTQQTGSIAGAMSTVFIAAEGTPGLLSTDNSSGDMIHLLPCFTRTRQAGNATRCYGDIDADAGEIMPIGSRLCNWGTSQFYGINLLGAYIGE